MYNWTELAQNQISKGSVAKAFFYLALAAIEQLTRIAQAQEQIAGSLRKFDDDVIDHNNGCVVTRSETYRRTDQY